MYSVFGLSLSELEIGHKTGTLIIAIREQDRLIANPGGDIRLMPGQLLIVLGSKNQLETLRNYLGDAVEKIGLITS